MGLLYLSCYVCVCVYIYILNTDLLQNVCIYELLLRSVSASVLGNLQGDRDFFDVCSCLKVATNWGRNMSQRHLTYKTSVQQVAVKLCAYGVAAWKMYDIKRVLYIILRGSG